MSESAGHPERADPSVEAGLEEIAEDLLDLLKRVRAIEELHRGLIARLDRLEVAVAEGSAAATRELRDLRRGVLGEGRTQATRHAFDAVVPVLDSLRGLANGLDADEDARMARQLHAVLSSLANLVQGLGYEAFEAASGEPFDPETMECLDLAGEGTPGVVLAAVRPGYRAAGTVIRPAGVRLAAAASTEA